MYSLSQGNISFHKFLSSSSSSLKGMGDETFYTNFNSLDWKWKENFFYSCKDVLQYFKQLNNCQIKRGCLPNHTLKNNYWFLHNPDYLHADWITTAVCTSTTFHIVISWSSLFLSDLTDQTGSHMFTSSPCRISTSSSFILYKENDTKKNKQT